MPPRTPPKSKTIRAVRVRVKAPVPDTPAPVTELSNYELLERRSRELEEARARGGLGTSQPPDAEKPLLFPKFCTVKETPQSKQARRRRST